MGITSHQFHTIPAPCAILPTVLCVSCVHRKVVEGSGIGSAGCGVHELGLYGMLE